MMELISVLFILYCFVAIIATIIWFFNLVAGEYDSKAQCIMYFIAILIWPIFIMGLAVVNFFKLPNS